MLPLIISSFSRYFYPFYLIPLHTSISLQSRLHPCSSLTPFTFTPISNHLSPSFHMKLPTLPSHTLHILYHLVPRMFSLAPHHHHLYYLSSNSHPPLYNAEQSCTSVTVRQLSFVPPPYLSFSTPNIKPPSSLSNISELSGRNLCSSCFANYLVTSPTIVP